MKDRRRELGRGLREVGQTSGGGDGIGGNVNCGNYVGSDRTCINTNERKFNATSPDGKFFDMNSDPRADKGSPVGGLPLERT